MHTQRRLGLLLISVLAGGVLQGAAAGEEVKPTIHSMAPESSHDIPPVQVSGVGPWVRYAQPRASFDFTFEYPQNWIAGLEEGRQQPYAQAVILGPRNAADSYSAGLTIRRQPVKALGGLYESVEALRRSRRAQYAAAHDVEIISEGEQPLGKITAWRMELSYTVPLPSHSAEATPTRIRLLLVQFAVFEQLYELSFSADASEYLTYRHVFDHLLASLRFTTP